VLNSVDLSIPANNKVAIVGQTGSGKSTLIQLLTRYWDPKRGVISIAGIDLTQWNESQLRESISVVSQRVDILNGSLRDNLLIAKPQASDEELQGILTSVGLEKLLEDNALDAWLGDGGRQLSGGEKRRIGIARAILHDAPILLLDEPTEGLDKQTEKSIMALFEQHFEGKTVIFITHRLIGLEKMDSIVLIEQGEIVEQGSHNELLSGEGRYFQLRQAI
ncbi:ATP-binding cassette domain-containing protein, partial [Vibrio fortis]